jgi:hypothetical protein
VESAKFLDGASHGADFIADVELHDASARSGPNQQGNFRQPEPVRFYGEESHSARDEAGCCNSEECKNGLGPVLTSNLVHASNFSTTRTPISRSFRQPEKSALQVAPEQEIDILHVLRALVIIQASPSMI